MENDFPLVWAVKFGHLTFISLIEEEAWEQFGHYYQEAQNQVQDDGEERSIFITSKPITLEQAFAL